MPDLRQAVQQHQALVVWLRNEFPDADDTEIADTAEGEGTLDLAIASVLRQAIEAADTAKALGERIKESQERKRRLEARVDRLKAICLQAAEDAGIKKIGGNPAIPDITASVIRSKGSVIITDEDKLPMRFVEMIRRPIKHEIGDALREGQEVPGAMLSNSAAYWMVRRS